MNPYAKKALDYAQAGDGVPLYFLFSGFVCCRLERWGAGVETQKNVLGEIRGWGRVPFNETYTPSLSNIYDGA